MVCSKNGPVVRLETCSSAWWVFRSRGDREKRQSSPICLPKEQCHRSGAQGRRTMGCERCRMPGRLPRSSPTGAWDRSAANAVKNKATKRRLDFDCGCRQRWCAGRRRDCRQSSVSQLRLSVIQAKELIVDNRAHCMRSRRQRFPTVRMHDQIRNGEV